MANNALPDRRQRCEQLLQRLVSRAQEYAARGDWKAYEDVHWEINEVLEFRDHIETLT